MKGLMNGAFLFHCLDIHKTYNKTDSCNSKESKTKLSLFVCIIIMYDFYIFLIFYCLLSKN